MKKCTLLLLSLLVAGITFGQTGIGSAKGNKYKNESITKKVQTQLQTGPVKHLGNSDIRATGDTCTFEGATFPQTGWTIEYTGTIYWTQGVANGPSLTGSAGAQFDCYNAAAGTMQSIISPAFTATTAGKVISFDVAHAPYTGSAEDDSLYVYTSTDGTTYTVLASYNGNGGIGVGIQTAAAAGGAFTPTATQWTTKTIALPVGTVSYKITAVGAYGNNIWVDNIIVATPLANDGMLQAFTVPAGLHFPGNVTLSADIKNNGSSTMAPGVVVTFKNGGTTLGTATTTTSLATGATETVTYTWNAATIGAFNLTAEIPADGNNANNNKALTAYIDNSTYLIESFEGIAALPPANWDSPDGWALGTNPVNAIDGVQYAYCGTGTDARLITPLLQCISGDYFAFYGFTGATSAFPTIKIQYSTDKVTWNDLSGTVYTLGSGYVRYQEAINLTGNYYFAYACTNAGTGTARVDQGIMPPRFLPADDASAVSIDMLGSLIASTFSPKGTVKNEGSAAASFTATLTIGTYTSTKNVTALASQATQQITFDPWTAAAGTYNPQLTVTLTGDANPANNTVTIPVTVSNSGWVYWGPSGNSDGIGTGAAANFDVATRFDVDDLAAFNGLYLTKMRIYPKVAGDSCTYTAKIWTGGHVTAVDTIPGTPIFTQVLTSPVTNTWNEITFSDIVISSATELWAGYNVNTTGGYPAGCDAGTAIDWKGNLMFYNNSWTTLKALAALDFNWNIELWISSTPTGIDAFPISTTEVNIFPVPAQNTLNINNLKNANVSIINVLGQIVYSSNNVSDILKVDVSNLSQGSYIVKVQTGEKLISKKINLVK